MAVLKNFDGNELCVNCTCGCDEGIHIKIDKGLKDTLQNLKELSDESALYSTSNLMRELQIIRNGYEKGE